ncbi:hypothetical protein [Thermoanaerobacterium thermosaccharolyticum]|jgi:metal-responsive CopG/Arc/MetJ family transcriptional regulator|uniref:hypothetical protein n=1 Tax=Thermoanaerobacterium thermosaccharolyticum TaxID=1517 RepID=UPI0017871285|nr:hypothetical protein [Thermoanaerobacterium thermosaccharolyticum]MBE0069889.1 hypothetical protein [Thermoanaerobacterium thermosaccharolyticum]MBE0228017.1 hypothetical protein [Thermoanaerobacterium thermosaccharolyticum]
MAKYTFRTKVDDKELDEILSSLQGTERADFIRNALYFYVKNKDIINNLYSDIADIKETLVDLKKNGINVKEDLKEPEKDNEDILKEMMNDFLNL